MMWLVLLIIAVSLIMVLKKRSLAQSAMASNVKSPVAPETKIEPALVNMDTEDDDLIAVITAAIHEVAGNGEFEVVSIKPSGADWQLTGRQELLRSRV